MFYNKSRDLDAKYIPPVNNLGVVYQKQGKFQKALAAFKLASDLNNFSITPTYNLAQLYLQFGNVGKSLPVFQALYKKSPNDISARNSKAFKRLNEKEKEEILKKPIGSPEEHKKTQKYGGL